MKKEKYLKIGINNIFRKIDNITQSNQLSNTEKKEQLHKYIGDFKNGFYNKRS